MSIVDVNYCELYTKFQLSFINFYQVLTLLTELTLVDL